MTAVASSTAPPVEAAGALGPRERDEIATKQPSKASKAAAKQKEATDAFADVVECILKQAPHHSPGGGGQSALSLSVLRTLFSQLLRGCPTTNNLLKDSYLGNLRLKNLYKLTPDKVRFASKPGAPAKGLLDVMCEDFSKIPAAIALLRAIRVVPIESLTDDFNKALPGAEDARLSDRIADADASDTFADVDPHAQLILLTRDPSGASAEVFVKFMLYALVSPYLTPQHFNKTPALELLHLLRGCTPCSSKPTRTHDTLTPSPTPTFPPRRDCTNNVRDTVMPAKVKAVGKAKAAPGARKTPQETEDARLARRKKQQQEAMARIDSWYRKALREVRTPHPSLASEMSSRS
jgi:hypothetical protein